MQPLIYGRRKSHRLRPGRQRLLDQTLPKLRLSLPEAGPLDPASLFAHRPGRIWLEIGFGGGEHLAAQAAAHPEIGLIGCEPFINGVARLLSVIEARGLRNVRLFPDDARLLMPALPGGCLERIFILFPDPWPKSRHHKRRIVNSATAVEVARLLQVEGELRLATDDMSCARAMLLALRGRPELQWQAKRPEDWRERAPDWPTTRYESKALAAGRKCVYLRFRRTTRDAEKP